MTANIATEWKKQAARKALEFVKDGMALGLGTGSTTAFFIEMLGKKVQNGELQGISAVPTSKKTAEQARQFGIPLTSLEQNPQLDLAVDGADEVDPHLNLIKGLGKALLREKIVEIHARRLVIIVDDSKLVTGLGRTAPLPVEIVAFQYQAQLRWLNTLGCQAELYQEDQGERAGQPVITDNGNYMALCRFAEGISDPYALDCSLASRPGIIESGLFLDMADMVVVSGREGIRILEREA